MLPTLCLGILPLAVLAQSPGSERDLARNFFDQGLQKIHEGQCDAIPVGDVAKCRDARELFLRAYTLDDEALGALRNLAQVEQSMGLLASAARHYRDLARKAPADPRPARRAWADLARNALTALQPRVPHLTVVVVSSPQDLQVRLDNEPMPAAAWGAPLEIDPGPHAVSAQATGYMPLEAHVDIGEADNRSVRVELTPSSPPASLAASGKAPPLMSAVTAGPSRAAPVVSAAPVSASATGGPGRAAPVMSAPPASMSVTSVDVNDAPVGGRLTVLAPWIVVGAGGLAIGAASAFGVAAFGQYETACPSNRTVCDREEYDKGAALADWSTALFVAGGAAVTGGVIWYLIGRSKSRSQAAPKAGLLLPQAGPTSVGLAGYFE